MSETLKNANPVKERLNLHYRIITLDLTKSRNNEEFDLEKVVHTYNELKVLRSDSNFDIVLNEKTNNPIPIVAGDLTQILNLKFDKLWIVNAADTGICVLYIASRWD
ncbi:hypothetical protein CEE45_10985 [Candidatus Heimdallarchaeota archaeon B3_Heim]|nr:MAG: hypothetical protein CEE45_10985 [Candidatus Heimdallarchaeota archaeon B3_Heim]